MAKSLFRQAALNRLASPEQLDQVLRITGPKDWIGLLAILFLLGSTAAWGIYGSVETSTPGEGVLVRTGGVVGITAPANGRISALIVKTGDRIVRGQVVAHLDQPALAEQVRLAEAALSEARAETDRSFRLRSDNAQLQISSLERQRSNTDREIEQARQQAVFAAEVVNQQEQLFKFGLVTRHPVVAAQEKLAGVQAEIARLEARQTQIQADRFAATATPNDALAAGQSRVADLERRWTGLKADLQRAAVVVSPSSGEVVEVKTYLGASVDSGTPLLTIQAERGTIEAVAYVAASDGKRIHAGLQAQVSPSTIRREEFGYIRASVISVAQFPSTRAALMSNFENDSLVTNLMAKGPATEIRLALEDSPGTPSGFAWSSGQGPKIRLTSGTLCSVQIVTENRRPVELVAPFVRGELGMAK